MKLSQAISIVEASVQHAMNLKDGRDAQYLVPYLVSGPGLGKTTSVKDLAKRLDVECKILSLAQHDAGEIAGWLVPNADNSAMTRLRPDWMPTEGKGILFLDELPQAPVSNQNIAAQIVNERRVGDHHLPHGWVIVAAGNRTSDRAGTNNMPSHLRDRLMFLEIEADLEDAIAYLNSINGDERVCAFLRFRPEWLHKFDRDANSFPSPRGYERICSVLSFDLDPICMQEAIAGQIGRAATADFMGFLKLYDAVPDIDALISAPDNAALADDPAVMYAICAALSSRINKSNAGNVIKYLKRIPQQEFAVFVIKDALNRNKDLKQVPAVRDWIVTSAKQLVL